MSSRKHVIILLVAAALTAMGLLIFKSSQRPASPPLPSPNGYDDFVKAGQMLVGELSDYRTANHEELRSFVAENAEALKLVRSGLGRECRMPIVYSQSFMKSHRTLIKKLALSLNAEGWLAQMELRYTEAARIYLETIRLGHEATRGGPLIDGIFRVACEGIGSIPLQNLVTNLNAKDCCEVIKSLEAIEAKEEPFAQVMQNESDFVRQAYRSYQRFFGSIQRFFNFGSSKQAMQRIALKFQTQDQARRELMIDLAAHAYELEKGQRPKSVADLVPDYLKAIPRDPITGRNMIYKP